MKKVKLDKLHQHEALDRTSILLDSISDYLLEHPYVIQNKDVKKSVKKAIKHLANAYQLIGSTGNDK